MNRQTLLAQNIHWIGQSLTQMKQMRLLFKLIVDQLRYRPMVFLTGMRRVGKSTLIKQVIQDLVKTGSVNPQQILFWEWNTKSTQKELEEIIEYYIHEVADMNRTVYLFFDEVQYIDNYENVLKLYYDRYEQLRFVLTGSLSFSYKKRMSESLAGRFIEHRLFPLSFEEYILFTQKSSVVSLLRDLQVEENRLILQGKAQQFNPLLREFLIKGRFPDTVVYRSINQVRDYLNSIINQSLNQDSIDYFGITKPREINLVYQYVCKNNGAELHVDTISKIMGISWQTVDNYLQILEQLGLIYPVLNTDNPLKQVRARKKLYTNSSFGLVSRDTLLDSDIGVAVESYVLERLLEQKRKIFYYRKRNVEVDMIDYDASKAIEIKFRSQIQTKDYKNLVKISSDLHLSSHMITLYQTELEGTDIICTPAYLF